MAKKTADNPANTLSPLRALPSVQRLQTSPELARLAETAPAGLLTDTIRHVLDRVRQELRANGTQPTIAEAEIIARVQAETQRRLMPSLAPAINATGIVLHTGLGRARLSEAACTALNDVARGHSILEIDRTTGQRGSRRDHARSLLCELTGAEDAMVVNNGAGAVFLAVSALAAGREVIISRGELVEIGGAFRMPDIVQASGSLLVEVGTTNRTRLADYVNAITERTGLILRCHPSNFALIGFTESTPTEELVTLGRARGIPVLDDQGSGALLLPAGLQSAGNKGTLRDSVAAGSDVIVASGDKLLGGPQAGLLLGKREYIEAIARHPLARALRVDKLTLAALEATLRLYREPERARREIPTLRYLNRSEQELRQLAQRLRARLRTVLPASDWSLSLVAEHSQVGGGSLPGEYLPTVCVRLQAENGQPSAEEIARALRQHTPPIFARIRADAVLFDPRALEPEEFAAIADALRCLR